MKLTYFAFKNNISSFVLDRLDIVNKFYIDFKKEIEQQVNEILENNPHFILGLGMYSGRDNDKIRIESKCSNKFRNAFINTPPL